LSKFIAVDSYLDRLLELNNELNKGLDAIENAIQINEGVSMPVEEDHLYQAYHSLEAALPDVEHAVSEAVRRRAAQSSRNSQQ